MPTTRSYNDLCPIARALDVVGERWALLVVRELLLGPQRFSDLRGALPGVSSNLLTDRLRELEARAASSAAGSCRRRQAARSTSSPIEAGGSKRCWTRSVNGAPRSHRLPTAR